MARKIRKEIVTTNVTTGVITDSFTITGIQNHTLLGNYTQAKAQTYLSKNNISQGIVISVNVESNVYYASVEDFLKIATTSLEDGDIEE